METTKPSPTASVRTTFAQLSKAAVNLNRSSDAFGAAVLELDGALKKLNLGVSSWFVFQLWEDGTGAYTANEIGYAKVSGKWGIALCESSGHETDPEFEERDEWLFNDAPRQLRLRAAEKIPQFLEKLCKDVEQAITSVTQKTSLVVDFAAAVSASTEGQADNTISDSIKVIPAAPVASERSDRTTVVHTAQPPPGYQKSVPLPPKMPVRQPPPPLPPPVKK